MDVWCEVTTQSSEKSWEVD